MASLKERPGILNRLCKKCGIKRSLPTSMVVAFSSLHIDRTRLPEAGGGFADVYRGEYNGRLVAVKRLRLYASDDFDIFLSVCILFCAAHKEPALNLSLAEVLPGSRHVETPAPSKHSTVVRCNVGPARLKLCVGLEVDGQR